MEESAKSETLSERKVLTELLYQISCQCYAEPDKQHGRRMALLRKLREYGEKRLRAAVTACLDDPDREGGASNWPSIAVLCRYVPATQSEKYRKDLLRSQALYRDAQAHPDMYIRGGAEIIAMMKIVTQKVSEKKPVDSDEIFEELLRLRRHWDELGTIPSEYSLEAIEKNRRKRTS